MASVKLLGLLRDVQAHQGNDIKIQMFLRDLENTVLNMTGWSLVAEIRYASTNKLAITCTLANGYLKWENIAEGKWMLDIPASVTSALQFSKDSPDSLDLVYDIELDSNSPTPGRFKPFYGTITLMREETRIA